MHKARFGRLLAYVLALVTGLQGLPQISMAAPISTQTLLELEARQGRIERVGATLSREEVQKALVSLGVSPAVVTERIASLTDEELRLVEEKLDKLPAGGNTLLVVLGILFVVLIILDLVGVTHIFTGVKK